MGETRTSTRTRRNKKKISILKKVLDERGIDYNWLADEMKRVFKINKKDTLDFIKGKKHLELGDKMMIGTIIRCSYKEFNY